MGILDFPTEVQLAIAELLPLCNLSTLSMTSKRLRRLTEPLIYSSIRMAWTLQDHPNTMLLLRTILDRPELGSHVRRLKLDGEGFLKPSRQWIPQNPAALPNIVSLQVEKLSRAANSAGVEESTSSWVHEVQSGSPNAVVALLLSLLPNLEWLSLSCNWTNEIKYIGLVFRSALCKTAMDGLPPRSPAYESLKHVELAPRVDTDNFLDPENTLDALSLFYLPNIEHLSVCIDNPIEFSWPCSTPPNPLLLTSLKLDRIREIRLAPLLSALKNLRKLHYHWFYQPDMDPKVSNRIVRLDKMAVALAGLEDTLTELEITGETQPALSWGLYDSPNITLQGSLDQLSRLHRLKRMQVPWLFLMGMTESFPGRIDFNLPPNVEDLALPGDLFEVDSNEWDDEMIISALRSELENGALSRIGCLKKMTVSGSYCLNREPTEYLRDLEALSVQFNLEVVDSRKDFIKHWDSE